MLTTAARLASARAGAQVATFADDEDIDFEELGGSGGGGVDVNGTLVITRGQLSRHDDGIRRRGLGPRAALAQALAPGGVFGGAGPRQAVLGLARRGCPGSCAAPARAAERPA